MSKGNGAIIVLEGPDCSGKTSLSTSIKRACDKLGYGYLYFHPHWPKQARDNIPAYYLTHLEAAILAAYHDSVVVMDRAWLSEMVYASVLRDGLKWPYYGRLFSRLDLRFGLLSVMCLPSDYTAYKERYQGNIDPDHPYTVTEAELVYKGYDTAYMGGIPETDSRGYDFLREMFNPTLVQQGWQRYDIDNEVADMAAMRLVSMALSTRAGLPRWQLDPRLTNWLGDVTQATCLMVVDSPNVECFQVGGRDYPLFGFDGYYKKLLEALQLVRIPESKLCWVGMAGKGSGSALPLIRLALATNPNLKVISLDGSSRAFQANKNPKLLEIRHDNIPCPMQWDREPVSPLEGYANLLNQLLVSTEDITP